MAKVLVAYFSRSGNTKRVAEAIAEAARKEGCETVCKAVSEVGVEDLSAANGIIIGSPVYYGAMAADVKKLFDMSVVQHGKLDGKLGAAFATAGVLGGGAETTIMGILQAMLIHGMIIQGDPEGAHYGVLSIGKPDVRAEKECERKGRRFAQLVKRVAG